MRWTEQAPRLPLQPPGRLPERSPALARVALPAVSGRGPSIAIAAHAQSAVLQHLAGHDAELGGLLLGEVFADDGDASLSIAVLVTQAVAAEEFASTGISLRMGSAVWERARARLGPVELIVGWYHSHPGLGAFFSATDRRTQRDFFPHAYSIGWVVDPASGDSAVFAGAGSVPPPEVLYGVADPVCGATDGGVEGCDSRNGGAPTTSTELMK